MKTNFTSAMDCFNTAINTKEKGSACYKLLVNSKYDYIMNFKTTSWRES